jgi:hypothetical protein
VAPRQKPGQTPAKPGEYVERGPRGGQVPNPRVVTIAPGDKPLPPDPEARAHMGARRPAEAVSADARRRRGGGLGAVNHKCS